MLVKKHEINDMGLETSVYIITLQKNLFKRIINHSVFYRYAW